MSGPQGYDPEQPWSSGQQEPPGSGEPTIGETWQQPAYTPPPFGQTEQYPSTGPEYQQPYSEAEQAGQQPTQYGPTQYGQPEQFQPTQYGQYSPGGEAYAPTGQYTPPGSQFGEAPAFGAPETAKGSKRSMGTLIGIIGLLALVVILAGVAVTGFWKPGYFWTTKLDVNAAQAGVEKVLTDEVNGYGRKNVTGVKCNDGANPTVEKGDTFTCDASVDGEHKQVTVTFKDDTGTYEVGRPT